jgi:hypothetical protein
MRDLANELADILHTFQNTTAYVSIRQHTSAYGIPDDLADIAQNLYNICFTGLQQYCITFHKIIPLCQLADK